MFNRNLPWWPYRLAKWGCLAAVLLLAAALLFPYFTPAESPRDRYAYCLSNEKRIVLAMSAYAVDNDEHLPNALTWATLLPLEHNANLKCPRDQRENVLSYDMPQRWSGHKMLKEDLASRAILLYEVGPRGLEYRHNNGMNVGYMDGHAKWHSQARLTPAVILSGFDDRQKAASPK